MIEAVRDGLVAPEGGARLVDLSKQFVLPGLIDMHVHIFNDDDKMRARLEQNNRDIEDNLLIGVGNARRTLEAGFTTVRDLGSDVRSVTALRDAIFSGAVPGPTIVAAGRGMSITGGHGDGSNNTNRDITQICASARPTTCNGADECRRAVREQISQGADVIKFAATGGVNSNIAGGLDQQMFADEMKAIIDTAQCSAERLPRMLTGRTASRRRSKPASIRSSTARTRMRETNALVQADRRLARADDGGAACGARAGARRRTLEEHVDEGEEAVAAHDKNIGGAIKDGVRIAFGTDTGVSDHGKNAKEFALLVKAGMTPASAIRAATVDAATLLDRVDDDRQHRARQGRGHHRGCREPAERRHGARADPLRDAPGRRAQARRRAAGLPSTLIGRLSDPPTVFA